MTSSAKHARSTVRGPWPAFALGTIALAGCAAGGWFEPAPVLRAYLASWIFFCGLALGSLVLLLIYCLTGGAWGFLVRRPLEAALGTLPLLAVLFLPIALGLEVLYPWARAEVVAHDRQLQNIHVYLNPTAFCLRAAGYLLIWNVLAWSLSAWSLRQDRASAPVRAPATLAGLGLLVFGVSIHFAAVDWIMSLQPAFHSTIFGPLTVSGQLLTALALAALLISRLARRPPLAEVISGQALNDVGSLLFAFLIIWGYMVFFQFMLIWIGNLPVDTVWYAPRMRDGWQLVAWAIFALQFLVPLFLLLLKPVKRSARALGRVSVLILLGQLAYDYYLVLPAFPGTESAEHWIDLLPPLGIGGLWTAVYLWQLERRPLVAHDEGNRRAALRLRRLEATETAREETLAHG